MSRLVIQGGQDTGREITLKPGLNRVGRSDQNDFRIADLSVSGHHCEIEVQNGVVAVRDLGSTNGTFINSIPVRLAILEPGQTLKLGEVELLYPAGQPSPAAVPAAGVARSAVRLAERPTLEAQSLDPPAVAAPPLAARGPNDCQNHPGVPATIICRQCGTLFCKSCVKTVHAGARDVHSCLSCGGICAKVADYRKEQAKKNATFGSLIAGAFAYPLKQNGPAILICATIFFGFLDLARFVLIRAMGPFSFALWLAVIAGTGYLFAFMQNIIVSSANGEENVPGWPDVSGFWDDMVVPFFRLVTICLVCTGPGIATMIFISAGLGVAVLVLGLFCLPMALLAVSMAGSIAGLNPLIIFSGITKIPGPYLFACIVLVAIVGLERVTEAMVSFSAIYILAAAIAKFVSLYGLTVEMRILGLLYYTNKEKLAWFG